MQAKREQNKESFEKKYYTRLNPKSTSESYIFSLLIRKTIIELPKNKPERKVKCYRLKSPRSKNITETSKP